MPRVLDFLDFLEGSQNIVDVIDRLRKAEDKREG